MSDEAITSAFLEQFGAFGHTCVLCGKAIQDGREQLFNGRLYGSACMAKVLRRINLRQQGVGDSTLDTCCNCVNLFLQNTAAEAFARACPSQSTCCCCCVFSTGVIQDRFCPAEDIVRRSPDLARKYKIPLE